MREGRKGYFGVLANHRDFLSLPAGVNDDKIIVKFATVIKFLHKIGTLTCDLDIVQVLENSYVLTLI